MHSQDKILITGSGGFIGSHLTEMLVQRGHSIVALVHYNSQNSWGWLDHLDKRIVNEVEVISGDIRDPFGVKAAMKGCNQVVHLAALIGIPYSYKHPEAYVETNIKGTLNILQAAKELEVEKVLHTSTSEVYGSAQYVPIDEKHPLQPQSPYSATKIAADQLALSYYYSFGLPITIIRPFNTYGPRQSLRAVIPTVITQLANGATSLKIGSLDTYRDFTFVLDTAEAFIQALAINGTQGNTINLGTNYEISILQLVKIIMNIMNREVEIIQEEVRVRPKHSEVMRLCSDNALAKKLLNWSPNINGIEGITQGLQKTVEWFSHLNNLNRYKSNLYNI